VDGLTSPVSITVTNLTSTVLLPPSGTLTVTTGSPITGVVTAGTLNVTNSGTTTLSGFLFGSFAPTPPSYSAQVSWVIGKQNQGNSSVEMIFKNIGVGNINNSLTIGPTSVTALTVGQSSIRIESQFQVNSLIVPPKTVYGPSTISSGTLVYPFNFSATVGFKRVVIHAIDVVKPGASDAPLIQFGYNNTYYGTNVGAYQGVTGGNNGAAHILWGGATSPGIYCWNSQAGAVWSAVPVDIYCEFQYLNSDSGYEVWAVTGATAITGSTTIYMNWFSGNIYANAGGFPAMNCLRLNFAGGAPTSGFVSVTVF
jgi:hypothetical protein